MVIAVFIITLAMATLSFLLGMVSKGFVTNSDKEEDKALAMTVLIGTILIMYVLHTKLEFHIIFSLIISALTFRLGYNKNDDDDYDIQTS